MSISACRQCSAPLLSPPLTPCQCSAPPLSPPLTPCQCSALRHPHTHLVKDPKRARGNTTVSLLVDVHYLGAGQKGIHPPTTHLSEWRKTDLSAPPTSNISHLGLSLQLCALLVLGWWWPLHSLLPNFSHSLLPNPTHRRGRTHRTSLR